MFPLKLAHACTLIYSNHFKYLNNVMINVSYYMEKGDRRVKKQQLPNGDYIPLPEFTDWMRKLLHLKRLPKQIKESTFAGEKPEEIRKMEEEYKRDSNAIYRLKNHYLDTLIFPNMANIAFFFDAINNYPELLEVFDEHEDIKDLLGVKRLQPRAYNYGSVFMSLVAGMIAVRSRKEDFRLKLMDRLGDLIWFKVTPLKIFETIRTSTRVFEDIGMARAWLEMLSLRVKDEYDLSKLSDVPYDKEEEKKCKTEEELNRYRSKLITQVFEDFDNNLEDKPNRTIVFDTKKLLEG
jgi:hypothetical protein